MPYDHRYVVRPRDNLTTIGRKFGYYNPGPIFAYPGNSTLFQRRAANSIQPNDIILVPWNPNLLKKMIATGNYLIGQISQDATKIINEQKANQSELEDFLFKIDALNFLAGLGEGIANLTFQGAKGASMTDVEAIEWLVESRVNLAGAVTTIVVPAPDAPRRDFKFYVRHALGPWNPSFWVSVYSAIKQGDVDIYLYGSAATTYKRAQAVKVQAENDMSRMRTKIQQAQAQLKQAFYGKRI